MYVHTAHASTITAEFFSEEYAACARALSNWPNANEGGLLPTLSFIDPSTAEQFRMFSPSLMSSSSDSLDEQTRIALTITLLCHYTEFKNDFPTHSLISRISESSSKFGFSMGLINQWEADLSHLYKSEWYVLEFKRTRKRG